MLPEIGPVEIGFDNLNMRRLACVSLEFFREVLNAKVASNKITNQLNGSTDYDFLHCPGYG